MSTNKGDIELLKLSRGSLQSKANELEEEIEEMLIELESTGASRDEALRNVRGMLKTPGEQAAFDRLHAQQQDGDGSYVFARAVRAAGGAKSDPGRALENAFAPGIFRTAFDCLSERQQADVIRMVGDFITKNRSSTTIPDILKKAMREQIERIAQEEMAEREDEIRASVAKAIEKAWEPMVAEIVRTKLEEAMRKIRAEFAR